MKGDAMQFTLIVPPVLETRLTGFVGAGERSYRGRKWRVELRHGEYPSISCEGDAVALDRAPRHAIELAQAVLQAFGPVKGGE